MYADCLIPLSVQKKTFCCTRDSYKTSCTENGVVVYAARIMAQENLSRPYHRKERPFWKSASADRRGRGTLLRQSRKATPGGAAQAARRSVSELSETAKQRRRPAKAPPEPACP